MCLQRLYGFLLDTACQNLIHLLVSLSLRTRMSSLSSAHARFLSTTDCMLGTTCRKPDLTIVQCPLSEGLRGLSAYLYKFPNQLQHPGTLDSFPTTATAALSVETRFTELQATDAANTVDRQNLGAFRYGSFA